MTSQIVSATIDEDFPVAGQDNDSQGFRDNFTIIKDGLATANSEITDLQNNVIIKGPIGDMAPEDVDNNFNETLIYNVRTNKVYGTVYTATTTDGLTTVDINNGEYQLFTLDRNTTFRFENWPDPAIGDVYSKIRIAFKTDGSGDYVATFVTQGGVLTPLQGASDSYSTGTDPDELKVVEAWSSDNGENVYLTVVGEFTASVTISDINSIGNVTITSPTNNQVLKYNSATSQWVNENFLSSLSDITGVVLTTPTNGQVLKFDGTNWINDTDDNTNWNGSELVLDASSVDLTKTAGYFVTGTVAEGAVLGVGIDGQIKVFAMDSDGGGDMVINVTNAGWGGLGTITFTAVGQGCTLQYFNNKWYCVGNNGATFS